MSREASSQPRLRYDVTTNDVDVLPRLATPAGFELGSGMSINPVLPEDAAVALRGAAMPVVTPPGAPVAS